MDIDRGHKLKGKRVLITAGPTWVAIDKVRVISNSATGQTGIMLAQRLQQLGARVTLLLGPVCGNGLAVKGLKLVSFKFFDELKVLLAKELRGHRYDYVIHSAAVSDYQPEQIVQGKIVSNRRQWQLRLVPTPKLISSIKRDNPDLLLVGFKFEPGAGKAKLMARAKALASDAAADIVVANTIKHNKYQAYLFENNSVRGPFSSKALLVSALILKLMR